uniref:Rho GTPase activating protein 27 n=1 Tax=Leptobrachium leishanense TaxID=445787 RepID=A0A8C5MH33_9ANUR
MWRRTVGLLMRTFRVGHRKVPARRSRSGGWTKKVMMQSTRTLEKEFVLVEYEFEYIAKDGRVITIKPNERYILLKRTNEHWWHVCQDHKTKPFYIPAKYVKVLSSQSLGSNGCPPFNTRCDDLIEDAPKIQYSYAFLPSDQMACTGNLPSTDGQGMKNLNNFPVVDVQRSGASNTQNVVHEPKIGTQAAVGDQKTSLNNNLRTTGKSTISPNNTLSAAGVPRTSGGNPQPMAVIQKVSPVATQATTARQTSPVDMQSLASMQRTSPVNTATVERSSPGNTLSKPSVQKTGLGNILPAPCVPGIGSSSSLTPAMGQKITASTTLPGAYVYPSNTTQTGLSLSLKDYYAECESSAANTMPIFVQEQAAGHTHTPMRTFHNSKKILDSKKRISFALPPDLQPSIRPTQSLNDLQNIICELPPDHPQPQPNKNELCQAQLVDLEKSSTAVTTVQILKEEEDPVSVYANLEEFRKDHVRDRAPSQQHSSTSTLDDWETHTDQGSGQLFYYNSITGETTWDCPFDQPEDSTKAPLSPASLSPQPGDSDWEKHFDEVSGQFYFYNLVTGETSWDPPEEDLSLQEMQSVSPYAYGSMEQRPPTPEADYPAENYPEADYGNRYPRLYSSNSLSSDDHVKGRSSQIHKDGKKIYTNNFNEPYLQPQDNQGKPYVYPPEGSSPQWRLMDIGPADLQRTYSDSDQENNVFSSLPLNYPAFSFGKDSEAIIPGLRRGESDNNLLHPGNHQNRSLEKAGVLHKAKTLDNGKRIRKNWSSSWTVLQGGVLTFFKDNKNSSSNSMKQATLTIPDHTVNLQGATLVWATKEKSSKKNVLELKTLDGNEYLIHHDSESITKDWFTAISNSIGKSKHTSTDKTTDSDAESPRLFGSTERLGQKDKKDKKSHGQTNSSGSSDSDRNVRAKLKNFLQRRPTLQSLRDKGYIKDQVFGCHLHQLCEREKSNVPEFVSKSIQAVEKRGLDIDGLYRVSGNLATIQKLRHKVDHDENFNLDDGRWEDVHVITGALKLFFRELPEPLFPFTHFDSFVEAIMLSELEKQIGCLCKVWQLCSVQPFYVRNQRMRISPCTWCFRTKLWSTFCCITKTYLTPADPVNSGHISTVT